MKLSEKFAYPELMKYFEEISAIPRSSYHEEKVVAYLVNFAKARGLEVYTDNTRNCLIDLPGTSGREEEPAILLQGHTDMVCEKNAGVIHDFMKVPLELYEKDGWIRAAGTTLGADDGVAVASMLYILDGALTSHPPIQCLFTASEEVGLDGAKAFDYSRIYAKSMINMDSADESQVICGCAGGLRSDITLRSSATLAEGEILTLRIGGLAGGHSGENINCGRANANKLMGQVLLMLSQKADFSLISLSGGTKDNAIPREACAVIATDSAECIRQEIETLKHQIAAGLSPDDGHFSLTCEAETVQENVVCATKEVTGQVIFLLSTVSNGVFEMSYSCEGLVEFSRNLGVLSTVLEEKEIVFDFVFSSRSSMDARLNFSMAQLNAYAETMGASIRHYNRYPGWTFSEKSDIRERYVHAFRKLYGKDVEVTVIHAGLECGIIHEKLPDLDIISCGPVVCDLHSPDEALNIASFERFFTVIKNVLEG